MGNSLSHDAQIRLANPGKKEAAGGRAGWRELPWKLRNEPPTDESQPRLAVRGRLFI